MTVTKPHLFRKVGDNIMTDPKAVAMYYAEDNLLVVLDWWWDAQPSHIQSVVWKSAEPVMYRADFYGTTAPEFRWRG
jgi:hypothetical protein